MTRVYISRTDARLEASLPPSVDGYISKAKSGTLKRSRLSAYSLLFLALEDFFGKENINKCRVFAEVHSLSPSFDIAFTEKGKPYLTACGKKADIYISLSHTEEYSAVAVSDTGEIGVDIEEEIDQTRAERLSGRFFSSPTSPKKRGALSEISAIQDGIIKVLSPSEIFTPSSLILADSSAVQEPCQRAEDQSFSLTERWVEAEAIMKCEGSGFGSVTRVEELSEMMEVYSAAFSSGEKRYFIALAKA